MTNQNKIKVKEHLEKSGYTVKTLDYSSGFLLYVLNPSNYSSLYERVNECTERGFTIELTNKNKFKIEIEN